MSETNQNQTANVNRSDVDDSDKVPLAPSLPGRGEVAFQDIVSTATHATPQEREAYGDSTNKDLDEDFHNHPRVSYDWRQYLKSLNGLIDEAWADRLQQRQLGSNNAKIIESGVYEKTPITLIDTGGLNTNWFNPDPADDRYPFSSLDPKEETLTTILPYIKNGIRRSLMCEKMTEAGSKYMMRRLAEFPEPINFDLGFDLEGKEYLDDDDYIFLGDYIQTSYGAPAGDQKTATDAPGQPTFLTFNEPDGKNGNDPTEPQQGDEGFGVDYRILHFAATVNPLISLNGLKKTFDRNLWYSPLEDRYIGKSETTIHSGLEPRFLKAICRNLKNQDPSPYVARPKDVSFITTRAAWEVSKLYTELEKEDPATADEKFKKYIDEHGEFGNEPLYNLTYYGGVVCERTKESMMEDLKDDDISKRTFVVRCSYPAVPSISIRWSNKQDWEIRRRQHEYKKRYNSGRVAGHNTTLNIGIPHQDSQTSTWGMTYAPEDIEEKKYTLRRAACQNTEVNRGIPQQDFQTSTWGMSRA